MSLSPDNAATIVCKEVFDEASHPSNEEVYEYAKRVGIDPDAEPHLLHLAREGLMAALPKGWAPVYSEAMSAYYYYQASTGTTTWEHPLDSVYRELVKQARAGNVKQPSIEEDSKTTAKDLDSHEEATLPKESNVPKDPEKPPAILAPIQTRIPTKLAPLKRPDRVDGSRKKSPITDISPSKRDPFSKIENPLITDRASRDYTNLRFQDPKFYECPRLLDGSSNDVAEPTTTTSSSSTKKELDLKEVLKRSESLSPRHEKDWEQLSSRFSSDENIIDIDRLSASTLARFEKNERMEKEKHPSHFGPPKELTLSGGGTIFLKSNRSRESTPSQEGGKLEELRTVMITDEASVGDRLKSILREKQSDDDDKHADEERKSVRFDLARETNIKFTYSSLEDDWESKECNKSTEEDRKSVRFDLQTESDTKLIESEAEDDWVSVSIEQNLQILGADNGSAPALSSDWSSSQSVTVGEKTPPSFRVHKADSGTRGTKIVGKRFLVQNVSENEHISQMTKDSSISKDSSIDSSVTKMDKSRKPTRRLSKDRLYDEKSSKSFKAGVDATGRQENYTRTMVEHAKNLEEMKMKLSKQHEKDVDSLRKDYETKLEEARKELEEDFMKQKLELQQNLKEKLDKLKQEIAEKEEQEIQKLIAEMDIARLENLKKVKTELETCYEKERQGILANLKTELDERRRELLELRNKEMGKLENEHEREISEEKFAKLNEMELTKQHAEKIETLKTELEKEFTDLRTELRLQQRQKITKLTEDHEKCLAEILRDFRTDEDQARKTYKQRLEEVRAEITRSAEKEARRQIEQAREQDNVDFEKMRCEKRLLQDKYTALKTKYLKLKNDLRLAVDKRNKRKEGYNTSETERSISTMTKTDKTDSTDQNSSLRNTCSSSSNRVQEAVSERTQDLQQEPSKTISQVSKRDSDDTITASESDLMNERRRNLRKKSTAGPPRASSSGAAANNNNNLENPVENIRKQLKKLEDLGDQLPSNETAYTLRYPFQDKAPANASSELEFLRHRLHVEKDSVRRAREALRHQRNVFQGRQRAWKQRSARATLEQLVQEERELSDMEVSLHRTWSLLGEKMIHLRHLEQSLERVANAKKTDSEATSTKNDELTLSDMSSASSGFSSTDVGTDPFLDKPDHYQESTEIIASLENLNSEIREIWGVLNKRQDSNEPPPPTLMYSYLRWLHLHQLSAQPTNAHGTFGTPNIQSNILSQLVATQPPTTTQNIIAQYGPNSGFTTSVGTVERNSSNLAERTRNLRDWLRQARVENADLVIPGQATL